jgi:hypothetical protein
VTATKLADRRVQRAATALRKAESDLADAQKGLSEAESNYDALVREIALLDEAISSRSARIDLLIRMLPPEEAEMHRQRVELATLRGRVETLQQELAAKRRAFSEFVEGASLAMVERSSEIVASFARYAEGFLLEDCNLVWSPQGMRVGQSGELIEFPRFELDMTGADFSSPVRRSGPEQVSESQREFIDLAFRMSLIEVAGSEKVGSLIIDAPESSLDAVFANRAANVLARFADPKRGNRMAVTSNLTDGELLPTLLRLASLPGEGLSRLVNLLEIAEPTAAIRSLKDEYRAAFARLFARANTDQGDGEVLTHTGPEGALP